MNGTASIDMLLRTLRMPAMGRQYKEISKQAEDNHWSFTGYLKALLEAEADERSVRRTERLLKRSCLPEGKTIDTINQKLLPAKVRKLIPALLDGDFVERCENVLAFGLPGRGKTHLLAAIGRELIIHKGYAVYFSTTHRLVEQLLIAKRELQVEKQLKKLDRFDVVILDDIGYVQQSREEMEVLFTFLAERYERRSLMISSNLLFSEWDKIFKDPVTTAAAIDRLVHHSVLLELNNDSFRVKSAKGAKRKTTPQTERR